MAQRGVIVVGAGPAGVRCADTLVEAGLKPIVIDEGRRDGGQIYRRQPENFRRSYAALYGTEAAKAQALHRTFDALRAHIDYRPETLAWNVADGHLHVVQGSRTEALRYDALVICSGATDRLMPVEGWNLAGCYSLGAAQIALKSQACAIGGRVVFVGTGPLLYLVASQYVKAGAKAVFFCYALPAVVEGALTEAPVRQRLLFGAGPAEPVLQQGLLPWTAAAGRTAWYLYDIATGISWKKRRQSSPSFGAESTLHDNARSSRSSCLRFGRRWRSTLKTRI